MADRVVVHSVEADAETVKEVSGRLRSRGIEIVEEQPHMLLVSGSKDIVGRALANAHGWKVTELTAVPRPKMRERILKSP